VRQLPAQGPLAVAAVLLALAAGCARPPAPAPGASPTAFTIPTEVDNGRIEITIAPSYPRGATLTIPVAISATRGTITGPLTARLLASGINEGGAPAEALVRDLATTPISAGATTRHSITLSWDTRDQNGAIVPADAYSLVLTFRSEIGTEARTVTAGATLELR
jgi:hypothetical protein